MYTITTPPHQKDLQMTNKHAKRPSLSHVTREIHITMIQRDNCRPTKMSKVEKTVNTKCWQDCRAMRALQMLLGIQNESGPLEDRVFLQLHMLTHSNLELQRVENPLPQRAAHSYLHFYKKLPRHRNNKYGFRFSLNEYISKLRASR